MTYTVKDIQDIVNMCCFGDYSFEIIDNGKGSIYLQAKFPEQDIVTGKWEAQHTRKWLLSPFMTKSEIVQTAFKCCLTSMEHIAREKFKYRGKRIFGPHFDIDALHEICSERKFDCRPEQEKT